MFKFKNSKFERGFLQILMEEYSLSNIRKALSYIKGNTLKVVIILIFSLLLSFFSFIQPWIFGGIIDSLTTSSDMHKFLFVLVVSILMTSFINFFHSLMLNKLSNEIERNIKNDILMDYSERDYSDMVKINDGQLIETLENDSKAVVRLIFRIIFGVFGDIFEILFLLVFSLIINFRLTLIILIFFPLYVLIDRFFGNIYNELSRNYKKEKDIYLENISFIVNNIKQLKLLNVLPNFTNKHKLKTKELLDVSTKAGTMKAVNSLGEQILSFLIGISVIILGIIHINRNEFTIGGLVAFNSYSSSLLASLFSLTKLQSNIKLTLVSLERIFEVRSLKEKDNSPIFDIHYIDVISLSFSYNNNFIFDDLSFKIQKNSFNLIIGESGSGKSTLLDIFCGLHSNYEGEINFNSSKNCHISNIYFYKKISYANQTPFKVKGTLKENIILGRDITEKDYLNAVKLSHLEALAESLTELDLINLSFGQMQKIALARCIVTMPEIYFFDEITSGLDKDTEIEILHSIKELSKKSIVVMVSHSKNALNFADQIIKIGD